MARIIEFNIPLQNGSHGKARGNLVILKIGERNIAFVLQHDAEGKARWLTHHASGYKFGTLDNAAVELMCRASPYHRFSKRKLAEFLIEKEVIRIGVDGVLTRINSVPIIN